MKLDPRALLAKLPFEATDKWPDGIPFVAAFERGNFELELFAPRNRDYQTPHDKDEFYIVISGTAQLKLHGELIDCRAGDALFVEKGDAHHFEEISDDFATWVVFF